MPGQQLPLRGHDQQGFSFPDILGLLGQRLSLEGTEFLFFGGWHRRQATPNRYGSSPLLGLIGGPALKSLTLMRPERQIPLLLVANSRISSPAPATPLIAADSQSPVALTAAATAPAQLNRKQAGVLVWDDLIVVAVHDRRGHVDGLQIVREVGFREDLDSR